MAGVQAALPGFELLDEIGRGASSVVLRARNRRLDRMVALKVFQSPRDRRGFSEARFEREGQALAKFNHPHIVHVYAQGEAEDEEFPYLEMEYLDGGNLRQLMETSLAFPRACEVVLQICSALRFAHEAGVVHRDIKPENILLDRRGLVKVADFGLAKFEERTAGGRLTVPGQIFGTPAYMAPEQITAPAQADHRADLYALGAVFYEMLSGEVPIGRFPMPSEVSGCPAALDPLMLRLLEPKPARRFQSAQEFEAQLRALAEAETTKVTPKLQAVQCAQCHTVLPLGVRLCPGCQVKPSSLPWHKKITVGLVLKALAFAALLMAGRMVGTGFARYLYNSKPDAERVMKEQLAENWSPLVWHPGDSLPDGFPALKAPSPPPTLLPVRSPVPGEEAPTVTFALATPEANVSPTPPVRSSQPISAEPQFLFALPKQTGAVFRAEFSPASDRILTVTEDKAVRLWDAKSGKLVLDLPDATGPVFSSDGAWMAAIAGKSVRVWDCFSGKLLATLTGHSNVINAVSFRGDGLHIATGSEDETARVWETVSGTLIQTLHHSERSVLDLDEKRYPFRDRRVLESIFSPDGSRVLTRCSSVLKKEGVQLWKTRSGTLTAKFSGSGYEFLSFSPSGSRFLTCDEEAVHEYETATGKLVATCRVPAGKFKSRLVTDGAHASAAAFSPDEKWIVTPCSDDTARVWDAESGGLAAELRGHSDEVKEAVFSSDSSRVLTVSADGTARLWQARNGKSIATLREVSYAIWSPDGRWILSYYKNSARLQEGAGGLPIAALTGHSDAVTSILLVRIIPTC